MLQADREPTLTQLFQLARATAQDKHLTLYMGLQPAGPAVSTTADSAEAQGRSHVRVKYQDYQVRFPFAVIKYWTAACEGASHPGGERENP